MFFYLNLLLSLLMAFVGLSFIIGNPIMRRTKQGLFVQLLLSCVTCYFVWTAGYPVESFFWSATWVYFNFCVLFAAFFTASFFAHFHDKELVEEEKTSFDASTDVSVMS